MGRVPAQDGGETKHNNGESSSKGENPPDKFF